MRDLFGFYGKVWKFKQSLGNELPINLDRLSLHL